MASASLPYFSGSASAAAKTADDLLDLSQLPRRRIFAAEDVEEQNAVDVGLVSAKEHIDGVGHGGRAYLRFEARDPLGERLVDRFVVDAKSRRRFRHRSFTPRMRPVLPSCRATETTFKVGLSRIIFASALHSGC
jgi:hypothetical protein